MVIKSPQKYAGRTLEGHLRLYDWKNEFYTFERTIKTSSFDEICSSSEIPTKVETRRTRHEFPLTFRFPTDHWLPTQHHETLPSTRHILFARLILQASSNGQRRQRESHRRRKGKSNQKQSVDFFA
jgi:hypothetical protein